MGAATAIRVGGLGKRYQIGTRERGYATLRDSLARAVRAPWRRFRRLSGAAGSGEAFWALRDVSFEVGEGEVVGIVGRNGAGKSTLLKLLSQITEPTEGAIELSGRVGSLLEVGTGFHPELTGRENIYLNGAILGMKRHEIDRKFDDIVAFSGIERFLETPVKRYSSGMYTRLAFSVAAHLEPEIMIVDEVLAVGDAAFQEKCLGKMNEVAHSGRTVLFVSHNMAAVETLCTRGIVLEAGRVAFDGETTEAVRHYYGSGRGAEVEGAYEAGPGPGQAKAARIVRATVTSEGRDCQGRFNVGVPLEFRVECECGELFQPNVGIGIENKNRLRVVSFNTKCDPSWGRTRRVAGRFTAVCRVPNVALVPGQYTVKLGLAEDERVVESVDGAMSFTVLPTDYFNNGGRRVGGVIFCGHEWQMESDERP